MGSWCAVGRYSADSVAYYEQGGEHIKMDFERVAIIGVDCISVSIALGLKDQKAPPDIVGYDAQAVKADLARARGAFDSVEREPGVACENADLVIVATPLRDIRETFAAIAPHLREDCFVTDIARLKGPVVRWADELLPENVSFAGGHIIPNPAIAGFNPLEALETASADLLKESLYCFTTPPQSSGRIISACTRLADILEAHHLFIEVTEHDGLQAGIEGLPDLLAVALLRATVDTAGWQEMRKFAGYRFAVAIDAVSDAPQRHGDLFLNRENILRRLNLLLGELVHLRDLLGQDDAAPLEEAFLAASKGRSRWMEERAQGMWTKSGSLGKEPIPSAGEQIGHLIFGKRITDRLTKDLDHSRSSSDDATPMRPHKE